MSAPLIKIGELAQRTGLSHRTIHYYESLGMIRPVPRAGGLHRHYDAQAELRIRKILVLKQMGLSLEEIASVLDAYFDDPTMRRGKQKVMHILQQQLAEADAQITALSRHRAELQGHIARLQALLDQI